MPAPLCFLRRSKPTTASAAHTPTTHIPCLSAPSTTASAPAPAALPPACGIGISIAHGHSARTYENDSASLLCCFHFLDGLVHRVMRKFYLLKLSRC